MKHTTAVFFRFLALLAVIFLGITAIIPQSTKNEDKAVLPVWNDINPDIHADIITVYKQGILIGGTDGEYGIGEPLSATEAAYAAVRMYEDRNELMHSFNHYNPEKSEQYIKKAKKYKLWRDEFPNGDEAVTREQFAAAIAPIVKNDKVLNDKKTLLNEQSFTYVDEILMLYNAGVMLDIEPKEILTRGEAVDYIMMCINLDRREKVIIPDYAALEKQLTEKMSGWQGDWSLYFEDLRTERKISINSHQVYSASLIKLFVAQTAYQKVAEGKLSETTKLNDEIRKMLTYSDNEAWKYIARALGGGSYSKGMIEATKVANVSGFSDTGQFYQGEHKNYNFTSVNDCGAFLKGLLNGTIVNPEYSGKILSLLKLQQHTHKIPAGIPDSVKTANKTGELDYIQGDAAIVYAPSGTYILCIIGDGLENGYGQVGKFVDLSKTIYEFLN